MCVHTYTAFACLHHHSSLHPFWMELWRGERKGGWNFFSPLLCFALLCFFIICKKGTKSQLSFKLSAAWEHPTSQKSSMSVWEPNPHLSLLFLRVCTCSCKVPLRQKALPKICALLGKVKPCQDKGSGDEEASVGLNRPFFQCECYRKSPASPCIAFPRADLGGLQCFGGDHCLTCRKVGVTQEVRDIHQAWPL